MASAKAIDYRTRYYRPAASKVGLSVEQYLANLDAGLKRCVRCKDWLSVESFCRDASKAAGINDVCRHCAKLKKCGIPWPRISQQVSA